MNNYQIANEILRLVKIDAIRLRFKRAGWGRMLYVANYKDKEIRLYLGWIRGELIIRQEESPTELFEFQLESKQVKEFNRLVKPVIEERSKEQEEKAGQKQAKKEEILQEMFPLLKL